MLPLKWDYGRACGVGQGRGGLGRRPRPAGGGQVQRTKAAPGYRATGAPRLGLKLPNRATSESEARLEDAHEGLCYGPGVETRPREEDAHKGLCYGPGMETRPTEEDAHEGYATAVGFDTALKFPNRGLDKPGALWYNANVCAFIVEPVWSIGSYLMPVV